MNLATTQDLFYLIGALSLVLITIFLCWALYEIARLGKQINEVMEETRDKMGRLERTILSLGEKLSTTTHYLGYIAEGGKQLLGFLHRKEDRATKDGKASKVKRGKMALSDMPDEE
jgi:hypothetical protein